MTQQSQPPSLQVGNLDPLPPPCPHCRLPMRLWSRQANGDHLTYYCTCRGMVWHNTHKLRGKPTS